MNTIRHFIEWNRGLSAKFDSWIIPARFRIDGNRDFTDDFAKKFLDRGMEIYDVGGGKNPYIDRQTKERLALRVVGLDIDANELSRAESGLYDETVCADISSFSGKKSADLVICQALLEHVRDVEGAFASIDSILKPGGRALIFVPSRNAVFARLNLVLPEKFKRWILFSVFPQTRHSQGFPSYYDRCTPSDFQLLARRHGFQEVESRCYYQSTYFSFFFPMYLVWRLWVLMFWLVRGEQAAETFSMALTKRPADRQAADSEDRFAAARS